jgi:hypothetical protein
MIGIVVLKIIPVIVENVLATPDILARSLCGGTSPTNV